MSPEQASGHTLDSRSDIFSFGVVLYEMLAGRRPFERSSNLKVLQKVIHEEPPPLGDDVPLSLRLLVEKALDKDPAERYQSMRDLVIDLRRQSRTRVTEQPAHTTAAPTRSNARHLALAATVGALAVAAALGIVYWRLLEADYFWVNPLEGARSRS
jgi:serine/threonine-protein kinase